MKVCLYAGDMNLNREDEKVCRNTKKKEDFLGNKTVKTFFYSKCFIALKVI